MRFATYRLGDPAQAGRSERFAAPDTSWARFGDQVVVYGTDEQWSGVAERAQRSGVRLRELPAPVDRDHLHLVVQNGRLFQQEHPEARVLVDAGRYLLVDLDPKRARTIGGGKGSVPCYAVRPVEDELVAFEVRERAAARAAPVPWVQSLVDRVSLTTFKADLTRLVEIPTRFSTSTHYAKASTAARKQLAGLGYTARRRSISVAGGVSQNVIADKPGGGSGARGLVLVTAHLDSINSSGGPAARAPGADDNGSGSAGVLEIARALEDHRGVHNLRFVLFGGEEEGLHGSRQYVASLTATDRARIRAVVNMDMIGTLNTPQRSVLLEGAAVSQAVIDGLAEAAATYTGLSVQTSLHAANSDHVPFITAGLAAVLTIEGADHTNGNIHSDRDTLDHIDDELALEILRMNTAFVASALGRP